MKATKISQTVLCEKADSAHRMASSGAGATRAGAVAAVIPRAPHHRAGQWLGDQRGDDRREQREVVPRRGSQAGRRGHEQEGGADGKGCERPDDANR